MATTSKDGPAETTQPGAAGQAPTAADGRKVQLRGFSARTWLAVVGAGLVTWMIIRYGGLLMEVAIVLFAAYLLSLAMRPLSDTLRTRYRIPRAVTVLAIYVVLLGLVYLVIQLTIPAIAREFGRFQDGGTEIASTLIRRLENLPPFRQLNVNLETVIEMIAARAEAAAGAIVEALAQVTRIVVDGLLVLVLAYFFTTDRKIATGLLFTWVPRNRRWRVRTVAMNTSARLSRWIVAQVALAAMFGILFAVGLLIMRVPFAVSIGVIGGVLEFVPFLGGAVSLILSTLVALTFRPEMVIWVIVLYFAIQQVQVNVLQPILYGRAADVHPAAVLMALLIGAQLGGVIGALFAVPIAVVFFTVLDEIEKPGEAPVEPSEADDASRLPGAAPPVED